MRVDTSPSGTTPTAELDSLAQVRRYIQALRRSWYALAAALVMGAALGWLSTPDPPPPVEEGVEVVDAPTSTGLYKAVHTVIQNNDSGSSGNSFFSPVNLSQGAYLVGTGDVPSTVATQLGLTRGEVEGSVGAVPRSEVSSIEIQAIGDDANAAVALADTSALVLIQHLDDQARLSFENTRDEIIARLDRLEGELTAINARMVAEPENQIQLEAQQRSLSNQYASAYEQFTQIANTPVPTSGMSSLQTATAEEISEDEFDRLQAEIRAGLGYQESAPTTVPEVSSSRSEPRQGASAPTRAVMGGLVGLALAIGAVLTLDRFDNRLRHREQVEAATGLAVLAEIPPLSRHQQSGFEVIAHSQHRSRAAEAYRVVRSALLFAVENSPERLELEDGEDGEGLVVMVTSANPEEGKTTTVANLASVLAEGGFSVLVVNCDFRRPRIQKYLVGEETEQGVEVSDRTGTRSVYITQTEIDDVMLVTGVGEHDENANPLDVVAMQRLIVSKARSRYDVILLDTAPFLTTNDASELLSETDQVLVVVRAGKTRRLAAARTAEFLARLEAPVVGVIMNDCDETPAAQYYYSYYLDTTGKKKRGDGYISRSKDSEPNAEPPHVNGSSNGTNGANGHGNGVTGGVTTASSRFSGSETAS